MPSTPDANAGDDSYEYVPPETPAPHRARVNNLTTQVSDLVRQKHALERKYKSEVSKLESQMEDLRKELSQSRAESKAKDMELGRCKLEGDGMRDELNLHSTVLQQKAVLALAQEQMQVIELERRLVQAETEKVMRDHKLALFKSKEDELVAEMSEKDLQLEELEAELARANSSMGHQRIAESKIRAEWESKVDKLENTVRTLKEREKEAREELEGWLNDEKSKEGSADKERRELQVSLRNARNDLQRKVDELEDLQQEMATFKETSKEREKVLRAKLKEANENGRLADLETELAPKTKATRQPSVDVDAAPKAKPRAVSPISPKKRELPKPKEKVRKATPVSESEASDVESPPKKAKKASRTSPAKSLTVPKKTKAPLSDSADDNKTEKRKDKAAPSVTEKPKEKGKAKDKSKSVEVEEEEEKQEHEVAQPEKKKKRKLLGAQPAFAWDSIMNSGDGLIPGGLSPIVSKTSTGSIGGIPRIGFAGTSILSKGLSRLS